MRITVWQYFAAYDYLLMRTCIQGSSFTSLYGSECKSVSTPNSNWVHYSFFIKIHFKRMSRLKFTKIKEYFRNKPEVRILKTIQFPVLNISKYIGTVPCLTVTSLIGSHSSPLPEAYFRYFSPEIGWFQSTWARFGKSKTTRPQENMLTSFRHVGISPFFWLQLVTEVPVRIWIRGKFKIKFKIDRSLKKPSQEYAGSLWWPPGSLRCGHLIFFPAKCPNISAQSPVNADTC